MPSSLSGATLLQMQPVPLHQGAPDAGRLVPGAERPARVQGLALAFLPFATGAGLVLAISLGVSLRASSAAFLGVGALIWVWTWPRLPIAMRMWLKRRVGIGLRVAIPAIVAYDAARYGLVAIASFSFQPFHVFPLFGQALLGPGTPEPLATLAGVLFHVTNGIGFSVAYLIVIARPSVVTGIAWALTLEAAMLLLYPGWLGLSVPGEFVPVSIAGHLAFGSTLGALSSRLVRR